MTHASVYTSPLTGGAIEVIGSEMRYSFGPQKLGYLNIVLDKS